jgi:hypothetical protein
MPQVLFTTAKKKNLLFLALFLLALFHYVNELFIAYRYRYRTI